MKRTIIAFVCLVAMAGIPSPSKAQDQSNGRQLLQGIANTPNATELAYPVNHELPFPEKTISLKKDSPSVPPKIASRENVLRKPDLEKLAGRQTNIPESKEGGESEKTIQKAVPLMTLAEEDPIEEGEFVTREEFLQLANQEGWRKGDFRFTPYGYFSISTIFETERTATTDYTCYTYSPEQHGESAFTVDPKSTRIGLKVDGPKFCYWPQAKLTGLVEIDFQGQYVIKNKPGLLFRRGFVEIGDEWTSFKFGQDWEIIAPLVPKMLNWAAGAGVGNIGYRRGLIEFDRTIEVTRTFGYEWQFGICANLTNDFNSLSTVSPDPSGWPVFEGRIAGTFGEREGPCALPITAGVFGHIGEQTFDYTVGPDKYDDVPERTWSFGCDLNLPISQRLQFQGEFFTGENLSTFFGGIFQGVDLNTRQTIRSNGGWGAFHYEWSKKWKFNGGYLIDDPINRDVQMTSISGSSRLYNHAFFANCIYFWNDAFFTGMEVSQWKTHWQHYDTGTKVIRDMTPGNSTRFEFVCRYLF